MRNVTWIVHAQTVVNTDDDAVARQQVASLFENKEWGDADGRELCVATVETMQIKAVEEAQVVPVIDG